VVRPVVDPDLAVAHGLFSRKQALAAGYTAAGIQLRLRRGQWERVGRGVLRVVGREERAGDRLLLAVLSAGQHAVARHRSAAFALGWDLLDPVVEPELYLPRTHGTTDVAGARVRRADLGEHEVITVGVLPVTTAPRTAIDLAGADTETGELEAVAALDSALRLGQVTLDELRSALRSRGRMPRSTCVAAQQVLDLLDTSSGSAPESVARVHFRRAGLDMPCCQYVVQADGRFLARVDFAWPEARLVVEVDGFAWHGSKAAFQRDSARQRRLQRAGWTVLRFTAEDVLDRPEEMLADVSAVLAERLGTAGTARP
jgi:hypothetical protein